MIHGRLEAFFETGTEGICWSVIDPSLPGYDGLWVLHDGDRLQIIGTQNEIHWDGIIELEWVRNWHAYPANPEHGQQVVFGRWVHGLQVDLDPEQWATMFFERYRARLTLGPQQTPREHPFHGPASDLADRMRAMPVQQWYELYRTALYPWLHFYSDGNYYSYAKDWDFTLDEIVRLIGSPTDEQIMAWKTFPKTANVSLMPFDWDIFLRIALLFGVYGALDFRFHSKDEVVKWLQDASPSPKDLLLSGMDGVIKVHDRLMEESAYLPP